MKFEQIEQFIKIIESGSISKAAMELHMAQSTLSTSLKKFEEEMGYTLIKREANGVSMTDKGMEVYHRGKMICEQVDDMRKSLDGTGRDVKMLSVANNFSVIGKDIFIELYNKYQKDDCKFKIHDCSISEAIQNVSSGEADVGLLRFPEDNKPEHMRLIKRKGLVYKAIARKILCVVVGEKNPFYRLKMKKIRIEQLANFPFVGYYDEEADIVYQRIIPEKNRSKANISIGGVEHLKEIIRKTDAFSLDVYKEDDFNSEGMNNTRYIPIEPKIYCEFGLIMKKDKNIKDIVQEYMDEIEKHFDRYEEEPVYEKGF